jgi:hypothetical protein
VTTISRPTYDPDLLDGVERLVAEFQPSLPAGRVIAAVGRARMLVRDNFLRLGLDAYPADEEIALILGMARRQLVERDRRLARLAGRQRTATMVDES